MGNSGILQFFGLNDLNSLKYVSERLGNTSMLSISKSQISIEQQAQGFRGESKSMQSAPLLSPDEVATLEKLKNSLEKKEETINLFYGFVLIDLTDTIDFTFHKKDLNQSIIIIKSDGENALMRNTLWREFMTGRLGHFFQKIGRSRGLESALCFYFDNIRSVES